MVNMSLASVENFLTLVQGHHANLMQCCPCDFVFFLYLVPFNFISQHSDGIL